MGMGVNKFTAVGCTSCKHCAGNTRHTQARDAAACALDKARILEEVGYTEEAVAIYNAATAILQKILQQQNNLND